MKYIKNNVNGASMFFDFWRLTFIVFADAKKDDDYDVGHVVIAM